MSRPNYAELAETARYTELAEAIRGECDCPPISPANDYECVHCRIFRAAAAAIERLSAEPSVAWCQICPHPIALHMSDGTCPAGCTCSPLSVAQLAYLSGEASASGHCKACGEAVFLRAAHGDGCAWKYADEMAQSDAAPFAPGAAVEGTVTPEFAAAHGKSRRPLTDEAFERSVEIALTDTYATRRVLIDDHRHHRHRVAELQREVERLTAGLQATAVERDEALAELRDLRIEVGRLEQEP